MPRQRDLSKLKNITATKKGQNTIRLVAKSRLQTLLLTHVIPDYVEERVNVDTGRLQSTIRGEKPVDTANGVEMTVLIGGIEAVSRYESKYGDIYGDGGPGTSRVVDYAAWLDVNTLLDIETGDLLEGLPAFVRSRF